jgi:hypothetical protein
MKFNIQYPPLVEQAYSFMLANGFHVTKDQVYKHLVESNMINENGNPTKEAVKAGPIDKVGDDDLIGQFKAENPLFAHIPDKHFKVVDGQVVMDRYALRQAAKSVLNDPAASAGQKDNARSLLDQVDQKRG